jgi:hypothetical protein
MGKIKAQLLPLLFVLLLAVLAGLPLFRGKVLNSHDSSFYPPRTTVFYSGLINGYILPRWTQEFAAGYGEPYFNFNAPLLYYINSFFCLLGFGPIKALNLSLFALLLASGLAMYFFASEFFGKTGGLVAATAYLFAPFTLLNLYVRGSYAEFSGIAFIPLTLWLFYKAQHTQRINDLLFGSAAFALMLLTNNTVSLMATPILALLICLNALRRKSLATFIRGAAGLTLGLMLSAFFWLPSVAEKSYVQTDKLLQGQWSYLNHFVYFQQLLTSAWGYGYSVRGVNDGLSFHIGYAHLALTIVSIFLLFKRFNRNPGQERVWIAFFLTVIGLAIFFVTESSLFVWQQVKLLQYLQFPWRFLILVSVATSFLCGAAVLVVRQNLLFSRIVPVVFIAGILLFNYSHAKPQGYHNLTDEAFSNNNIVRNRLEVSIANEFRPRWAAIDPPDPASGILPVLEKDTQYVETYSSATTHRFRTDRQKEALVQLNIHYFPGWQVFIDGRETGIDFSNKYGLIAFSLPAGPHEIEAKFVNTPVRTIAELTSITGMVLLLSAVFFRKKLSVAKLLNTPLENQQAEAEK